MIQAQIEQIADEILSDGTYVSGGKVSINRSGNDLVVSITPGRMYALGFVHPVPAGEVVVTGSGREVVSLLINSVVVTEEDDPSLLDPATGTENEGDPGAHRLTVSYQFVLDNPNAIPVAVLLCLI
jgi:hypothetical protein